MQDQSQLWLNVRRDRPDYLILWGWGVMNSTAIEEAVRIRYPMDRFIGAWWSGGEDELRPAGDAAKGFKTLNLNGVGTGFPVIRDIRTYVVDKGLSRVEGSGRVGESLYNRGVMNAVLIAEAIRHAQWLTGKQEVSAEDMRRGLETLDLDAARLKELGLAGFMAPLKLTCTDHSGAGELYVQAWDGTTWRQDSEWFPPLTKIVRPALELAAVGYVKANEPWPKRTEPCDE